MKKIITAVLAAVIALTPSVSSAHAVGLNIADMNYSQFGEPPVTQIVPVDANGSRLAVIVRCSPGWDDATQNEVYEVVGRQVEIGPFVEGTWQPGGLSCTAELVSQHRNGRWPVLATDTFNVN